MSDIDAEERNRGLLDRIELLNEYTMDDDNPKHIHQITFPRSGTNWLSSMMHHAFGVPAYFVTREVMTDEIWCEQHFLVSHPYVQLKCSDKMKYVFSIRDPRDVIRSNAYRFHEKYPDCAFVGKDKSWVKHQAKLWHDHFDYGFMECPHLLVQYEKLCLYPLRELDRIKEFIGLPFDKDPVWLTSKYDRGGSVVVEPDKDYYGEHCNKWKRDPSLHKNYNEIVMSIAYERMEQFGYLIDSHGWEILHGV